VTTTQTARKLSFVTPPPGLSPLVNFVLEAVEGAIGLFTVRSAEHPDVRLFVVDPAIFIPEYSPSVSIAQLESIGVRDVESAELLVVTTIEDGAPIANLLAPVVVNTATGQAAQLILESDEWPLRADLTARLAS
jgi:flagellar assembly factor FliW